ncbi:hypothetical protein HYU40_04455 [Candidatus Woesearchaeota archaeon]|nr:hypothetical protein [Candidatus Woesearchaeota archaeon]
MASITLPVSDEFRDKLKSFSWVNWSEIAREETMKKLIFENYVKTGILTDDDWEFCEKIDWHPVDELPIRDEFKRELMKRRKGPFLKFRSVDEIFKR